MAKAKLLLILIFAFLFSDYPFFSFAEKLTIATYYPSPIGIYKELRAKRIAIGENYYNPSDYCWTQTCSFSVDDDADLIVEGKVGIGTENPQEELHVTGNAIVENDLSINGNVQLGDSDSDKTIVEGNLEVHGRITTTYIPKPGDINKDSYINSLDMELVSKAWGCTSSKLCWVSVIGVDNLGNALYGKDADINGDGIVNIVDASIIGLNYNTYKDFMVVSKNNPAITAEGSSGNYSGYFKGGKGVKVEGDLIVTENAQLGDSSSDKTTVKGDLDVSGCIYGKICDLVFKNNFKIVEAEDENALYFLNQKGEKIMKLDENGNLFVKGKIIENFDFKE